MNERDLSEVLSDFLFHFDCPLIDADLHFLGEAFQ